MSHIMFFCCIYPPHLNVYVKMLSDNKPVCRATKVGDRWITGLAHACWHQRFQSCDVTSFRRGLIMGLWNSHTSVGNILGSLIAGYWVSSNWGLSFIVPGIIIAVMGVVCFLFLIEREFVVRCGKRPSRR